MIKKERIHVLLIQNGLLYDMEANRRFRADLLVRDGKIAEIAENIPKTEDMRVVDAAGMHVLPGLIDAHSHIGIA